MDVKMAAEGRNKAGGKNDSAGGWGGRGRDFGEGRGRGGYSPPPKIRRLDEYDDRRPLPPRDDPYAEDSYRRPAPPRDGYYDRARDDPLPYRRDIYPSSDPYRDPYRDPIAPSSFEPLGLDAPIDCVIFTLGRHLDQFAESILRRLRSFGVVGSMLPLSSEISVKPAMEDVTRRGSPFAIVLNDQNEAHQSCTVNILHGTAQEHRNMPLEDALMLVERSFETFLKEQKQKAAKDVTSNYQHLPPGAQIQYLFNLLADNHHLTADELTKVIEYLEDRKKGVIEHEGGPSAVAVEQEKNINKQQQELQAKILSILGPDASTPQIESHNIQPVPPPQPLAYSNASVQQALDTLMQSGPNLLQSIGVGAPPPPDTVPPLGGIGGMSSSLHSHIPQPRVGNLLSYSGYQY